MLRAIRTTAAGCDSPITTVFLLWVAALTVAGILRAPAGLQAGGAVAGFVAGHLPLVVVYLAKLIGREAVFRAAGAALLLVAISGRPLGSSCRLRPGLGRPSASTGAPVRRAAAAPAPVAPAVGQVRTTRTHTASRKRRR